MIACYIQCDHCIVTYSAQYLSTIGNYTMILYTSAQETWSCHSSWSPKLHYFFFDNSNSSETSGKVKKIWFIQISTCKLFCKTKRVHSFCVCSYNSDLLLCSFLTLCQQGHKRRPGEKKAEGKDSYWPICFHRFLSSCFQTVLPRPQFLKVDIYSLCKWTWK